MFEFFDQVFDAGARAKSLGADHQRASVGMFIFSPQIVRPRRCNLSHAVYSSTTYDSGQ